MSLLFKHKRIIASLILASFILLALFSLDIMMHGTNDQMFSNCPLSLATGTSLCSQSAIEIAFNHISAYQSFFSVPINNGITASIILILLTLFIILIFIENKRLLLQPSASYTNTSYKYSSNKKRFLDWLSLFENSPSRI